MNSAKRVSDVVLEAMRCACICLSVSPMEKSSKPGGTLPFSTETTDPR